MSVWRGHVFLSLQKLPRVSALDPLDARHHLPFLEVSALLREARSPAPIIFQCFLFKFFPGLCFCFYLLRSFSVVLQLYFQLHNQSHPIKLLPRQNLGRILKHLFPVISLAFVGIPFPCPLQAFSHPTFSPPPAFLSPLTEEGMILPLRLC